MSSLLRGARGLGWLLRAPLTRWRLRYKGSQWRTESSSKEGCLARDTSDSQVGSGETIAAGNTSFVPQLLPGFATKHQGESLRPPHTLVDRLYKISSRRNLPSH